MKRSGLLDRVLASLDQAGGGAMLDELGEHCRVGDVVSTFDAGGAALFYEATAA